MIILVFLLLRAGCIGMGMGICRALQWLLNAKTQRKPLFKNYASSLMAIKMLTGLLALFTWIRRLLPLNKQELEVSRSGGQQQAVQFPIKAI